MAYHMCLGRPMPWPIVFLLAILLGGGIAGDAIADHDNHGADNAEPTADQAGLSPDLEIFLDEAKHWLLEGDVAPPDVLMRLQHLAPGDRLLAIAYLRRIGVYDGPVVPTDALLAPASSGDDP